MVLLRALGWLFLALAVAAIVNDCLAWWAEGAFRLLPLGELWSRLDYGSLHRSEELVDQHVSNQLWRFVVMPALKAPALPVFTILGAILLWMGSRSGGQRGVGGPTVGSRPPRRRRGRSGIS
jgi:hypothetical protein